MAISLNQIIPWGRSRREYELMFRLGPEDFTGELLDCGGGPASFTAELTAAGFRAISVDPLYAFSGPDIRTRFEAVVDSMMAQVKATPNDWIWSFHPNPEGLRANRQAALERFLNDYNEGRQAGRYVVAELPLLPFESNRFHLAVCSHLLFLYSELLSEEFHVRSILELCRVAHEVRVFPLLTLRGGSSPHLKTVQSVVQAAGWRSQIDHVAYELQRGGNQMLRIFRI